MSTQPPGRRLVTESVLHDAEVRLAAGFDPKGSAVDAEASAKDYAATLAYGTNLEATDATVASLASDPGAEFGSLLGNNYVSVADSSTTHIVSNDVRRLIVTKDRETHLAEGDVLIPEPTPRRLTDFHRTPVGELPAGWVQRWVDGGWSVVSNAEALSGKVLRTSHDSGEDRYGLTWLDGESIVHADAELVARWRTQAATGSPRLAFRGSAGGGDTNAALAYLDVLNNELRVGQFINGSFNSWSSGFPAETGKWYTTRARLFGNTLSLKCWTDGEGEPSEWGMSRQMSFNGTPLAGPGWVGLQVRSAGTDIDWVGLALDGGRAPMPEVM